MKNVSLEGAMCTLVRLLTASISIKTCLLNSLEEVLSIRFHFFTRQQLSPAVESNTSVTSHFYHIFSSTEVNIPTHCYITFH